MALVDMSALAVEAHAKRKSDPHKYQKWKQAIANAQKRRHAQIKVDLAELEFLRLKMKQTEAEKGEVES